MFSPLPQLGFLHAAKPPKAATAVPTIKLGVPKHPRFIWVTEARYPEVL